MSQSRSWPRAALLSFAWIALVPLTAVVLIGLGKVVAGGLFEGISTTGGFIIQAAGLWLADVAVLGALYRKFSPPILVAAAVVGILLLLVSVSARPA